MLSLVVCAIGALVLLGWAVGSEQLVRIFPSFPAMAPSVALCFVLISLGLDLRLHNPRPGLSRLVLGTCAAVAVAAIANLLLLARETGAGIDALLGFGGASGGAMALSTATEFLLAAYCLAAMTAPRLWNRWAFAASATAGLAAALAAMVGYALDAGALLEVFFFSTMALHTALGFVLLHVALLVKRPDASWMGVLIGPGPGSRTARRILPLAMAAPLLLCVATLGLVDRGIFDVNFRLSLLAIVMMGLAAVAVLYNAEAENRAERQSLHDSLTDLPNRRRLGTVLRQAIVLAGDEQSKVGLMICNIDQFSRINEILGDTIGDRVLSSVAQRLRDSLDRTDVPARIGGDEFAVVLCDRPDRREIESTAAVIRDVLMAPTEVGDGAIDATTSIGVAVYPDDATDAATLRRYAHLALSSAKSGARRRICYYNRGIEEAAVQRAKIERELLRAVRNDELTLHYQPQIDLQGGHVRTVEALVRWNRNGHGLVPPAEFIAIAEKSGLIRDVGRWVLEEACRQAVRWREQGQTAKIAVNVSPAETEYEDFPDLVDQVLERTGLDACSLELEITEGLLVDQEHPAVRTFFDACRTRGISLALDDFGTGYSSLSSLRNLPVSKIKIDRSFVSGLGKHDDEALLETLVEVGLRLDKRIVAEGIETEGQLEHLRRLGCHDVQGYLLCPPVDAAALETRYFH